jgi:hypothetical protein
MIIFVLTLRYIFDISSVRRYWRYASGLFAWLRQWRWQPLDFLDVQQCKNKAIKGGSLDVMSRLPPKCADLVLTALPLGFLDRFCGEAKEADFRDLMDLAAEIGRVLKDTGSFIINLGKENISGIEILNAFSLVFGICRAAGLCLFTSHAWHNPASRRPRCTSANGCVKIAHSHVFWLSRDDGCTYNSEPLRDPHANDIRRLFGDGRGKAAAGRKPQERERPYASGSLIEVAEIGDGDEFPQKLAEVFLLASTTEGALVVDPFLGSGSTAVCAALNKRDWIGISASDKACGMALARVEGEMAHRLEEG